MNRKQLTLLMALFIVVGAVGFYLYNRQSQSWSPTLASAGGKVLPNFPINDVAQIVIEDSTNRLRLIKPQEIWLVQERWNYPASFSQIGDFLRKIWGLKSVQSVPAATADFGRLNLLPPGKGTNSATLIQFDGQGGKKIDSLLLGKEYMRDTESASPFGGGGYPAGRYLAVPGQSGVWLISDALTEVEPKPDRWLDKDFIKVTGLRSISITSTNPAQSWKVTRDSDSAPWKLANAKPGEELDSSRTYSLSSALSSASFNDVAAPNAPTPKNGFAHPRLAELETGDHFIYQIQIGNQTNDDNYFFHVAVSANLTKERKPERNEKPADKAKKEKEFQENLKKQQDQLAQEQAYGKWIYLVSRWTIDPLLKDRKDLLAEKKTNAPPASAAGKTGKPKLPPPGFRRRTNAPAPPAPPLPGAGKPPAARPPLPTGATNRAPPLPIPGIRTNAPAQSNASPANNKPAASHP